MSRAAAAVSCIAAAAAGSYLYATPYISINQLREAVKAKDTAAIERHVDFPKLRSSVKEELKVRLAEEMNKSTEGQDVFDIGINAIGMAIADPLINAAVDTYVSPSGLQMLMTGTPPNGGPLEGEGTNSNGMPSPSEPVLEMNYKDINVFRVTAIDRESKETVELNFERSGLVNWKLAGVKLP